MAKFIRVFTVCFFGLFVTLVLLTITVLNSASLTQRILPGVVNPCLKGARIEKLVIGTQRFRFPAQINFSNLQLALKVDTERYDINMAQLNTDFKNTTATIAVYGVDIKNQKVQLAGMDVKTNVRFQGVGLKNFDGFFVIKQVELIPFQINRIYGEFQGNSSEVNITNFKGDFYNGKLSAQVLLNDFESLKYRTSVELDGVDLKKLQSTGMDLFTKMKGQMDGVISLTGTPKGFENLEASFNAPQGGMVQASLLSYLIQYIPKSTQRSELEVLVKKQGDIPVEKADVKLKSVSANQLATAIDLMSRKFNLDIHLTVDVKLDGGLMDMIKYFQKVSF